MTARSFEKGFTFLRRWCLSPPRVRCAAIAITLCSHWSSQNLQFVNQRWSSMLRPWDFKIVIRRNSKVAGFLQIAHAVIDEIKRGRLAPGTALPGSRELAQSLAINRKTVIQAYAELEAQGWVTSEKTRGTFVSAHLPEIAQKTKEPRRGRIPERPDFRLVGSAPNIPLILPEKNMLVFDDGAPDTRQIPVDALARAYRNALSRRLGRGRLGYGDPRGTLELRSAISKMLNID